ncbi:MAG: hypothetical protein IAE67_08365 [Candidatus Competibacteraceae bacterium]|nr:hypothetical protein [Candidatus Competibacteraceae bacterium]
MPKSCANFFLHFDFPAQLRCSKKQKFLSVYYDASIRIQNKKYWMSFREMKDSKGGIDEQITLEIAQ